MKNIAVILAAGAGTRLGSELPKQFLPLAGKPVVEHSIEAFERCPQIDEVIVVTRPECTALVEEIKARHPKLSRILLGGRERYHSTLSALEACPPTDCNIIIHDAARPLVSRRIIDDTLLWLERCEAVGVAVRCTDTVWQATDDGTIANIPERATLWNAQTPQAFRTDVLHRAFALALADPHMQPTDDCSVVKRYLPHVDIHIVEGEAQNIKITFSQDIALAERLLASKP